MALQRQVILALVALVLALGCITLTVEASGPCSYIKYPLMGSKGKNSADKNCYLCCVKHHKFNYHKRSKFDRMSCTCAM